MAKEYPVLVHKFKKPIRTEFDYINEKSEFKQRMDERKHQRQDDPISNSAKLTNYISKEVIHGEGLGKVFAGGYMRKEILAKFAQSPEKLDPSIVTKELQSINESMRKKYGTYYTKDAHHICISLSENMMKRVEKSGMDLDRFIHKVVTKSMKRFNEKFHKDDVIGYGFGIHHDTDNRHAHIILSSRTEKGKGVGFSYTLDGYIDIKGAGRKNQYGAFEEMVNSVSNTLVNDAEKFARESRQQVEKRVTHSEEVRELNTTSILMLAQAELRLNELYKRKRDLKEKLAQANKDFDETLRLQLASRSTLNESINSYYNSKKMNSSVDQNSHANLTMILKKLGLNSRSKELPTFTDISLKTEQTNVMNFLKLRASMISSIVRSLNIDKEIRTKDILSEIKHLDSEISDNKFCINCSIDSLPMYLKMRDDPHYTLAFDETLKSYSESGDLTQFRDRISYLIYQYNHPNVNNNYEYDDANNVGIIVDSRRVEKHLKSDQINDYNDQQTDENSIQI